MGFSLKSVTKSVSRAASNVGKAVSKAVKDTGNVAVKAHVDAAKTLQIDKAMSTAAPIALGMVAGPAAPAVAAQGGQMDIFGTLNGLLGGDTPVSKLANSALSGLLGGKPQPVPRVESAMSTPIVMAPSAPASGTDWKMIGMVGGGAAVLLIVVALIFKRK